jgi:hypothetical protein
MSDAWVRVQAAEWMIALHLIMPIMHLMLLNVKRYKQVRAARLPCTLNISVMI